MCHGIFLPTVENQICHFAGIFIPCLIIYLHSIISKLNTLKDLYDLFESHIKIISYDDFTACTITLTKPINIH